MSILLASLLFAIVGGFGWFLFKREKTDIDTAHRLHPDYFRGLNYLINEQSDQAVDVFIKLLEVDTDTVEMHLVLGNLFRQRGEVDRAIRIHQNIIARPQLHKSHRIQALSALAEDYFRAGVLDRAEKLFLELVQLGDKNQQASHFLLMIYQQEKEWLKAIDIAKKIEVVGKTSMQMIIAQYYCELALQKKARAQFLEMQNDLKRAEQADKNCVRASLIRGDFARAQGDYELAIQYYERVKLQDRDYVTEIIMPVMSCYERLSNDRRLKLFLMDCLNSHLSDNAIFALLLFLKRTEGVDSAIQFLTQQMKHISSLSGLKFLIELYALNSDGEFKEKLSVLNNLIDVYVDEKPPYQCSHCGLASQTLNWLCPSCHRWVTVKPISNRSRGVNSETQCIS